MSSVLFVVVLWMVFLATHVGLATGPVRPRLVSRLGESGFALAFSAVASLCFIAVVSGYAGVAGDGPRGFALGGVAIVGVLAQAVVAFGIVLMTAGLWRYPTSNYAVGQETARAARGVSRITRHPFFVGLALVGLAHVLLATRAVGAVFMAGFSVVALFGAWHQDRKLAEARGQPYRDFMAETSVVPFAAILARRQSLVWNEMPWAAVALGLVVFVVLRLVHSSLFVSSGAPLILATVGGAGFLLVTGIARLRRAPSGASSVGSLLLFFALTGVAQAAAFVGLLPGGPC